MPHNSELKIIFLGHPKYEEMYRKELEGAGYEFSAIRDFGNAKKTTTKIRPGLGVIACFGKIIPEDILKIPKHGFLNIHPSLLPRWRGPSPVRSALLAGEEKTGLTIHLTTAKVDAGDIIFQEEFPVEANDNYLTLEEKLFSLGAKRLPDIIKKWVNGGIHPQKQDESAATYSKKARTEDGLVNWVRSPEEILRQIRAYSPDPGVYALINRKRLKIKRAEMIENKQNIAPGAVFEADSWPAVKCGHNALKLLVLQPEGKKDMPGDAYLRGHKEIIQITTPRR